MNLVLLTKNFPYLKGEPFIENEIDVLSKNFDKILILACDVRGKDLKPRMDLPENVECIKITSRSKLDKLTVALKTPFRLGMKEDSDLVKGSFKKRLKRAIIFNSHKLIFKKSKKAVTEFVKNNGETIFYSYWMYDIALTAIEFSKQCGGKVVTRANGYDLYEYLNLENYLPFRKYILNSAKVFPGSCAGEKYLKERYKAYSENISCSYMGTNDFGILDSFREKPFKIVSCSNLVPLKRVKILIEAINLLQDKYEIFWTHFGDGELKRELYKKALKILKPQSFSFEGAIANSKLMETYQKNNFDLFVNCSETEGLPVSIMEAISFGIPVVATDVGGMQEIVKDNENGLILKPDLTSEKLSEAIEKIINMSSNEYSNMRNNARKIWEENFVSKINYDKFSKIIKKI